MSTNMDETDDAYTLVSPHRHPMELVYADYANAMKHLANQARVELSRAGKVAYSKEAKREYQEEFDSLFAKLKNAESNTPKERAAQRMANATIQAKQLKAKEAGEKIEKKELKKASQQALTKARTEVGSVSRRERNIVITDKEWEAIQKGAISESMLERILNNSDPASLRQKAMPKETSVLTPAKVSRIKAMSASYTIAQIADKLGISKSTVSKYLKGEM